MSQIGINKTYAWYLVVYFNKHKAIELNVNKSYITYVDKFHSQEGHDTIDLRRQTPDLESRDEVHSNPKNIIISSSLDLSNYTYKI